MAMPGAIGAEFSLTTPFVQRGRENMAAYMAVDSNPLSPDYGTIRVLQLPQDTAILGPSRCRAHSSPTRRCPRSYRCTGRTARR